MVAAIADPVTSSRTSQTAAAPAAAIHRLRLRRGGHEARAGRPAASPRSLIEHRP
jgi:hypothetical protein